MTDFGRRAAVAAANVLPKTGQTIEYHAGDDGDYEKGWEGDRFTNNEDGTITDNAASLMWIEDALDSAINMITRIWEDQIDHIEALDYAGHADWRMPNVHEMQSLLDYTQSEVTINPLILNAQTGHWWTSTTDPDDETRVIFFEVAFAYPDFANKTHSLKSLCVRDV